MQKAARWIAGMPWSIVAIGCVLVAAGLVAIARAESLGLGPGGLLERQAVWAVLALAAMLAMSTVNYRVLWHWAYPVFLASIVLLVAVFFFPPVNGARRWIRFGPIGVQPSEIAKIALVLALARYLMYRDNYRRWFGLALPLLIVMGPLLLVLREPDLGTALTFLPVLFAMLFAAGARKRHLAALAAAALLTSPVVWSQMSREQRSRVTGLFEQNTPVERPSEDGYHLHQAKQMLALGGVWGSYWTGPWVDDPSVYFLPEGPTDSVLGIIGERFGLVGVAGLLGLFVLLAWRGLAVARSTDEPFGRLAAVGFVALLAVQVTINSAMMVGLLPITGLSLPLVSYGGSGLLAQGIALGLLLSIGLRPGYEVTGDPFRFARVA